MQEITFSVAVITYNQEESISQTLDSILNQEHDYKGIVKVCNQSLNEEMNLIKML